MSEAVAAVYRVYDLPWTAQAEQELKFRRLTSRCLAIVLILSLVISVLPAPEPDPTLVQPIPQRFARFVLEEPTPPPPPPIVEPEPEPEPIIEPEPEQLVETPAPTPEPEPIIEPEPPPAPIEPVDVTTQARERAAVAGLLPFAQDLAALRSNATLDSLDRPGELVAAVDGEAPVVERSLITSRAGGASAGIDTATLSRSTGGQGLAGRATTQVQSPIDVAGGGPAGGEVTRAGTSNLPSRSREEIELVFDRNKGAIFALYNRALRENPALVGKVVLQLTIEPDGRVSACEVVSSELGDVELERRLVQRVLLFQFEAKDVERITTTKPIDFFPA